MLKCGEYISTRRVVPSCISLLMGECEGGRNLVAVSQMSQYCIVKLMSYKPQSIVPAPLLPSAHAVAISVWSFCMAFPKAV